jgi:uncharacterized protein YdeI (YjbR/CyaY-like superfamily)
MQWEEKEEKQGLLVLEFRDQAAWEQWLEHNHDAAGVWLKFAKKGCPTPTVNYAQALEVALCYGWIDGQVGRYNDRFYLQRFTPRTRRSKWSEINREKATALIAQGRMKPAGLAQVNAAREDGRWDDAYAPASRAAVPDDFQAALDAHPQAAAFFATLSGSARYAFLYRLHNVKRRESRERRIADYIELLNRGQTLQDR